MKAGWQIGFTEIEAQVTALQARITQAEQVTEPNDFLDTTATPGNVAAAANIRQGRLILAASAVSVVITHPRLTLNSQVMAFLENSGARSFGVTPASGQITIVTPTTTALPIRWRISSFGDEAL